MIIDMQWLYCLISSLVVANVVVAGGGYGSYRDVESDCGGTCGGGGGGGGGYSAPVVISDGCGTGQCEGGYDDGSYYKQNRQSSGYHRSETSVVKETNTKHLKITIGAPVVHKISRIISQPAPVYRPRPRPQRVYKQAYSDCDYGCGSGGGSKIVKVIKKTTYKTVPTYAEECTTCGAAEYVEQPAVVVRKVTKIIKRPKVVKVIKVVDEGHGGGYGGGGGGGGGYGSAESGAYAYSSSSAQSGGYSRGGGGYGGGGGGCRSGCDEWKK